MKQQTILTIAALLLAAVLHAQQRTSGIVLDFEQRPVAGANVSVKGSTQSTITDIDGYFELSTRTGDVLQINLPQQKTKFFSANRLAVWVDAGMTTPIDVWVYKPSTGEYSLAGGGVGIGYQCYNRGFLFETGIEFRSTNYNKQKSEYVETRHLEWQDGTITTETYWDWEYTLYRSNGGFVQIPLLIGFEVQNFYLLMGGKVGTQLYNLHDAAQLEYKYLRLAPAWEFGWNFDQGISAAKLQKSQRGWSQEGFTVNYKVAFSGEVGFDFAKGWADDWLNIMLGVKFTVAFSNKVTQKY